jgi:hypothetical protein
MCQRPFLRLAQWGGIPKIGCMLSHVLRDDCTPQLGVGGYGGKAQADEERASDGDSQGATLAQNASEAEASHAPLLGSIGETDSSLER